MSVETLAALAAVVALAFTVESTLGFGATVITVSLGSLFLPMQSVLPAFVPVNLCLSLVLAARNARHADLRLLVTRIVPGMLLGLPLGMWAFSSLPEPVLRRAFGVFLLLLSIPMLLGGKGATNPLSRGVSFVLLWLAGVIHGAFATGGPMVVYVLSRSDVGKTAFRATLAFLWAGLAVVLVARFAWGGFLDRERALLSAKLLAPMLVGLVVGNALHGRIAEATFRKAVNGMLLVFGVILVVRG